MFRISYTLLSTACLFGAICATAIAADPAPDTACWGVSPARNNVLPGVDTPLDWKVGKFNARTGVWDGEKAKNVKWVALLGTESYATPIIADGKIFVATNNGRNHLPRFEPGTDLGVLLCFDEKTGEMLWQLSRPKLEAGMDVDWPEQGICSNPAVEGKRLWVVTNRGEVMCLDTEGFRDGKNDGPFTAEEVEAENEADILWSYDMVEALGVYPHNMTSCSPVIHGDLVFVGTSHGVDEKTHTQVKPGVPSFIALNKNTGELVWQDASPGQNILHGHWSSPAIGVFKGAKTPVQVIFPGPDGWLYAFSISAILEKKPALVWKFDCNPKDSLWRRDGAGKRNSLVATPSVADGRVFIAVGDDPEFGEGEGILWCIDPTKEGDVSPELVVDAAGNAVPPRRVQNYDQDAEARGEKIVPNPNSAEVWRYTGAAKHSDGKPDFEKQFHRSLSAAAVADDILITGDHAGLIHAVDAKTGAQLWTYDMMSQVWGTPLIAGKHVYVGDADGDVAIFALSRDLDVVAEIENKNSIYGGLFFKDGCLYVLTRSHLIAVGKE